MPITTSPAWATADSAAATNGLPARWSRNSEVRERNTRRGARRSPDMTGSMTPTEPRKAPADGLRAGSDPAAGSGWRRRRSGRANDAANCLARSRIRKRNWMVRAPTSTMSCGCGRAAGARPRARRHLVGLFPICAVFHRGTQISQAQSSICLVRVLGELWDGDRVVAVDCAGPVMSGPGRRCGDAVQCCRPVLQRGRLCC